MYTFSSKPSKRYPSSIILLTVPTKESSLVLTEFCGSRSTSLGLISSTDDPICISIFLTPSVLKT